MVKTLNVTISVWFFCECLVTNSTSSIFFSCCSIDMDLRTRLQMFQNVLFVFWGCFAANCWARIQIRWWGMRYLASCWFAFLKMAFDSIMFVSVEFCWKLLLAGLSTANKTYLYRKLWSWKRKPKLFFFFTFWFWQWEIEGNALEMQYIGISLYFQAFLWEFLLELLASFDGIFTSFMLLSQQNFYFKRSCGLWT